MKAVEVLTRGHPDCIRVAALHHHLIPVEPIMHLPQQGKNFSLVTDASDVLRTLYQKNFAVIMHGHQHQPYCADIRLHGLDRATAMSVVGTGSIGAQRSALGTIARNHYNIVEISTSSKGTVVRVIGRQSSPENDRIFESYKEMTLNLGPNLGLLK